MSKMLGKELSPEAMKQLNARESTVVLATISDNGFPNTTPIHLIMAPDPTILILGINNRHTGYENILDKVLSLFRSASKADPTRCLRMG